MTFDILARIAILITLSICVIVMPLAYVAKHRWGNMELTQKLSAVGVASMLVFLALVYRYIPE